MYEIASGSDSVPYGRSASVKPQIGAVVAAMPARTAAPLPRCGRRRTRMRSDTVTESAVPSVLPSSATMISPSIPTSMKKSCTRWTFSLR